MADSAAARGERSAGAGCAGCQPLQTAARTRQVRLPQQWAEVPMLGRCVHATSSLRTSLCAGRLCINLHIKARCTKKRAFGCA